MKKCISFLLILALMLTMIPPVSAFAAEETTEFITIEVSVDTTVREKASQDAKVLSKVKQGGYLISTGSVTNRWGNVWFRVVDPTTGEEGFIYSGKVHEHQCDYRDVDGCDALEFCSCGNIRKVASGMMHTNAYALPAQVLDPDVVAAICASGAAIGSAATAVFPYVVVVVAFGALVYMSVKVADNSVTIDKVSTDWRRLDADFKPDEGLYYNGMVKDGFFYIDVSQPMDVNEAIDVVEYSIMKNKLFAFSNKPIYWFVYTLTDLSAMCLVDEFISTHYGYTSNFVEDAHDKGNLFSQFKHYHITETFDWVGSHLGGHILFDAPKLGTFNEGMWA